MGKNPYQHNENNIIKACALDEASLDRLFQVIRKLEIALAQAPRNSVAIECIEKFLQSKNTSVREKSVILYYLFENMVKQSESNFELFESANISNHFH